MPPKGSRATGKRDAIEAAGAAKRETFMAAIKDGLNITKACERVGWQDANYRYHRRTHPDWAARVDMLRAAAKQMGRVGLDIDHQLRQAIETPTTHPQFVAKWFPDRRPLNTMQIRIAEILGSLSEREVVMVLVHPEIGKTATLEDWVCRKLAFDPTHRIRYVSEAADLAKRVVGTVQRRFTDTAEYGPFIERYGPFYEKGQERNGRPWTTEQITLANNPGTERDRNLVASSWTSAVYGSRIDTLVLDDLQSQRNYNQAEEIFRRIRGTFFNRGIGLRTLIVGTRIGPGDFYERMLDAGLVTRQIVMPVLADDGVNPRTPEFWERMNVQHNGGPCCMGRPELVCPRDGSELTPAEKMGLLRFQSGEETWWSAYMQQPRADARSTFSEFLDRCLDKDRRYGPLARVG